MTLGEILEKATKSDRVVVVNAAGHVLYRGYTANADHAHIDQQRRVKRLGIGMETYRKTDKIWDWQRADTLPEQIPVEQFSQFEVRELEHIIYIRIELESEHMS